jgi:hypothetical protein
MLPAVHLDDESGFWAIEIDNVITDDKLPIEL